MEKFSKLASFFVYQYMLFDRKFSSLIATGFYSITLPLLSRAR